MSSQQTGEKSVTNAICIVHFDEIHSTQKTSHPFSVMINIFYIENMYMFPYGIELSLCVSQQCINVNNKT